MQTVPDEGARCHDDHDGHDHAEGAEEEEEGYKSDPETWFQHEGRECMCEKGTLKCKRVRRARGRGRGRGRG